MELFYYQKYKKPTSITGASGTRYLCLSVLAILIFIQAHATTSYAQRITLTETNVPLRKFLKEIRKQTGLNFVFNTEMLKGAKSVTVHVTDTPVEEVLKQCFASLPYAYTIRDNAIVVKMKDAPPPVIVRGKVVDERNMPIPGVNVIIKGTTIGTATDSTGGFAIRCLNRRGKLLVSFIGYISRELDVPANGTLHVQLMPDTQGLDEVVVIGYGTSDKRDLTGSVTSIKAEDFNTGVFTSPGQMLRGKVAGLNVSQSSDPNQRPSVVLRGPSTIRANGGAQEPFYVIDGVPGASIDFLAPSDIESMDVLKDAASTAIYGSRAANVVIMITTRKARKGQSMLSYSAYGAVEKVSKKIEMLSGPELRQYLTDNGQAPLANPIDDDGSNTNWQNMVERTGYSQSHNISFNTATANSEAGGSINYFRNNGIIRRTALERKIFRGYINQRFFDNRLTLRLNLTNSNSDGDDVYQQYLLPGMLFYLPTVSPFNPDGTYKENYTRTGSGPLNPLSLLNNNTIHNNSNKTLINAIAQVEIIDGLQYTLSVSTQRDQNNNGSYLNSQSGLARGSQGVAHRSSFLNTSDVVESYFNYDRNFGDHGIKLLAGYSFQQNRTNDGFGVQTQRLLERCAFVQQPVPLQPFGSCADRIR